MKTKFTDLLLATNREGMESVIKMIEAMGFFTAPASTRFHLACEGGLLQHSLNVYEMAIKLRTMLIADDPSLETALPIESVTIVSLLHDICKADIYKTILKWQKDEYNKWIQVPAYDVDYATLPLGHGEKSLAMLFAAGLKPITRDEMLAIRWHMGPWELPFQSYDSKSNLNTAKEICPLLNLLQAADGLSSSITERE